MLLFLVLDVVGVWVLVWICLIVFIGLFLVICFDVFFVCVVFFWVVVFFVWLRWLCSVILSLCKVLVLLVY